MTGHDRRAEGALPLALLLAAAAGAGGCTAMTVANLILDAGTAVSLTVHGDEERLAVLVDGLQAFEDVRTVVRVVHLGTRAIELVGTYAAVLDAVRWIAGLGLELVANDEVTAAILEAAAIAFLK